MASHFSANQYVNAFKSVKLQNWTVNKRHKETPETQEGFTQVVGDDRGHLLDGIPRSKKNPWGNFLGTWDLPRQIPGNCAKVNTARTPSAQMKLEKEHTDADKVLSGTVKNSNRLQNDVDRGMVNLDAEARMIRSAKSGGSVRINAPPSRDGRSGAKNYPKTKYPTPDDYRNLTPVLMSPDIPRDAINMRTPSPMVRSQKPDGCTCRTPTPVRQVATPVGQRENWRTPTPRQATPTRYTPVQQRPLDTARTMSVVAM